VQQQYCKAGGQNMRLKLRLKIVERYGSQIVAAKALGIDEPRLSRIVRGHVDPKPEEREKLIAAFGAAALRASAQGQVEISA
jgi:hypothetical protein